MKTQNRIIKLPDGSVFEYPTCDCRIHGGHCGDGFAVVNPNQGYVQNEKVYLPCQILCVNGLCQKSPMTANLKAFTTGEMDIPLPDCGYRLNGKCLKVKKKDGKHLECILCLISEICYEGWC